MNELETANRILKVCGEYVEWLDEVIASKECIPPQNPEHQFMLSQVVLALKSVRSKFRADIDKAIK